MPTLIKNYSLNYMDIIAAKIIAVNDRGLSTPSVSNFVTPLVEDVPR
jgi:hypothetical protein